MQSLKTIAKFKNYCKLDKKLRSAIAWIRSNDYPRDTPYPPICPLKVVNFFLSQKYAAQVEMVYFAEFREVAKDSFVTEAVRVWVKQPQRLLTNIDYNLQSVLVT